VIVGVIRRKPVLTYASIVCDMLASVKSVNSVNYIITDLWSNIERIAGCSNARFRLNTVQ